MASCMGKALLYTMMRRGRMVCSQVYQKYNSFLLKCFTFTQLNVSIFVENPFTAGRYHSLVIEKDTFPHDELEITAWTEDGLVMAARHKKYRYLQGVQFRPESIITTEGKGIVRNFVRMIERRELETEN